MVQYLYPRLCFCNKSSYTFLLPLNIYEANFFFGGGSFCLLGLHPWHMEVPRLGIRSELQLPAYTRAMATPNPNHVCNLHHSSQHHRILNPPSKARDRTRILMDPRQMRFCCAAMGAPWWRVLRFTLLKTRTHHICRVPAVTIVIVLYIVSPVLFSIS